MQKSVIEQILGGINAGRGMYEGIMKGVSDLRSSATLGSSLYHGDNLTYMKQLLDKGYAGGFNLIYIDPPFFTRTSFNASVALEDANGKNHRIHHLAYDDKFDRNLEYYIENMTVRLLMMRDLLADDGLMWVHLDWHSSHYIKLVMDELMGEKNFINEIIWCYKSGGSGKRHFARKHDSILVYSKTGGYKLKVPQEKSYNRDMKPYRFNGVEEYRDDIGWYTMVNMKDVWSIDMVGRTSAERTGYATQKPVELMKRIVDCCTDEGDLAGDFFCGSGSLLEAAESLGRRWIGCDSEQLAASMSRKRLMSMGAKFTYIEQEDDMPMAGKAEIAIESKEKLESGKYLYKLCLSDLIPDIDTGSIQLNDRKIIEDVLNNNRPGFADYIMIDASGSSEFSCDKIIDARSEDMSFIAGEDFKIRVVDVFGKEYTADVDFSGTED